MTTARFSLRALWCDQGMAHLLETYESIFATAPTGLALVDFGAETMFKSKVLKLGVAAPAVAVVVNMLLLQAESNLTPKLDFVLISHQDTDHWSLLNYLMDLVDELSVPMKVGRIIYAGADWGKSAITTVQRLAKYGVGGTAPVDYLSKANTSDYKDANGTLGQLVPLGDVVLRTLVANAPIASKAPSLRKNGTSAVIATDYRSQRMILPGDATWETLDAVNKFLGAWTTSPVQPVKLVSAPHHGSLETMTKKNEGKGSNLQQLETFTELTKPEAVIASAGFANSFKHPYLIILKTLGKYADPSPTNPGIGKHATVVYMINEGNWRKFEIENKNVYTTVLGLDSPVPVANFLFTQNQLGFFTDFSGFYGPCKAMVSVPSTSFELMEMDTESSSTQDSKDEPSRQIEPLRRARPRRLAVPAVSLPAWMPPPRRVAPVVRAAPVASLSAVS